MKTITNHRDSHALHTTKHWFTTIDHDPGHPLTSTNPHAVGMSATASIQALRAPEADRRRVFVLVSGAGGPMGQ